MKTGLFMILEFSKDAKWCRALTRWLLSSGVKVLVLSVGVLVVKKTGKRALKGLVREAFQIKGTRKRDGKREETLVRVLSGLFNSFVWVLFFLMVLPEFGINVQALLAGVGVLGLALGMASKEAVSNYVSGVFILFSGQYGVGDEVEIGKKRGEVVDVNLRRTVLKDKKGNLCFVPHRKVGVVTRKERGEK